MTWLAEVLRTRTTDWFFGAIRSPATLGRIDPRTIEPETSYLSVTLRSLRIPYARRGFRRFHGAVSSRCSLPHRSGAPAQFVVVTTPPDLKGVESKEGGRMLTLNQRLMGPVPYRGGGLELELALLSIKAEDLAGRYLEVLEMMSSVAGAAFVTPALALARPLLRGIDLLLGVSEAALLEVGVSTSFSVPRAEVFALIGAPRSEVESSDLRFDDDYHLFSDNRGPLTDHPYVVFSIEAHHRRDDWSQVPDVRAAHEDLMREVRKADFQGVTDALGAFRRTAVTSPDLLAADGVRLADLVTKEVASALGTVATAGTDGPGITPLDALILYPA